ncbi:uncharacterized protein [Nicotiana tomentosiformis]|uniref:uncharacterized protein n=1 Tax=Nicotiana tomentosiformis TaxID=4098 RepID=UPI00388CD426
MKREKLDKYFGRFLEMLKQIYVNIPFMEVLTQMPAYAKFLKEILSSKRKLEKTTVVKLNAHCSAILQNKIPQKCGDPGNFTIPCSLWSGKFDKALCDFSVSIKLMPLSVFIKLEDFIVVDMEVNKEVPLILGRPFLCTCKAILDIYEGNLMLRVGNEKVVFQMKRMMKYPSDEASTYSCFKLDMVEELAEKYKFDNLVEDNLERYTEAKAGGATKEAQKSHWLKLNQIPIAPEDVDKTTFMCPSGIFAYRRMSFGLCDAPATFQRCMMFIFSDLNRKCLEVFMDDLTLFGDDFEDCLKNLNLVLERCEATHLVLNCEKCHSMVKEGIVLGHKVTAHEIEVDRDKVDVIARLPPPTSVKGIRSFLGHAGFYRRFIKNFSSITKPLTTLLVKDAKFVFNVECLRAFELIKEKLVSSPIMVTSEWSQPFEIMYDASGVPVGAVLGQRKDKMFRPIYYASRTLNDDQVNYVTIEKEFFVVVFAFDKIISYLVGSKVVVHMDHSALKYMLNGVIRRCVAEGEMESIISHCHDGAAGRNYGGNCIAAKVIEVGFYWTTLYKDTRAYVAACDKCQRPGNISKRDEMPLNSILVQCLDSLANILTQVPQNLPLVASEEIPDVVPQLKEWVEDLVSQRPYSEHAWIKLSKGRWEARNHGHPKDVAMRPPSSDEYVPLESPAPRQSNEKKRKRGPRSPNSEKQKLKKRSDRPVKVVLAHESSKALASITSPFTSYVISSRSAAPTISIVWLVPISVQPRFSVNVTLDSIN